MIQPDCLFISLPRTAEEVPFVWAIGDGQLFWSGLATEVHNALPDFVPESIPAIAIVPVSLSALRSAKPQGLEPRQELAVARIEAQKEALGSAMVATAFAENGQILVATVDRDLVDIGIALLADLGFWVKSVIPAGAIVSPGENEVWAASFGGEQFLRSTDLACLDEPAVRTALFGDRQPILVGPDQLVESVIILSRDPKPDFLDGKGARRSSQSLLNSRQWLWVKRLGLAAALLLLAGWLAYWAKLQWAIHSENEQALIIARKIDPAIADIATAEEALNRNGSAKGKASMLAAIVWRSAQASETVALTDLKVGENGLLTATLSAPDAKNVDPVLIAIQRAGYRISVSARRDPSGVALVDLTMRTP